MSGTASGIPSLVLEWEVKPSVTPAGGMVTLNAETKEPPRATARLFARPDEARALGYELIAAADWCEEHS